ncbi:2-succinyl-5-enolpyruvyl-6-hydroxy-3-cyclohexene-1-carboxylic-acid synthase [Pseudactinotalea terrae]|uniref:2-succinyl-5-enolpyruvyl-6-hydroxy-3- cyclohexene-1-carboxylic-acid synthase n=1 Tax=Pseudactinotalea terrae TaxID=1743262 RepID=UPI001F4FE934|nr:2-succinyl-5-enolpyruvyl-6-hydroxy-3-cyclohexene-1-carboxylic-acid synthase [Pseudactinotalea terrae]
MSYLAEHPAALAAREIVTALVNQGVKDVVLAPGSRSAPLAYALAAAEAAGWLRVHVRIDERVAGFVALGIARVRPAAVVTTSGTAVANLHPAVLEAHHSRLPLIVVSADRPHELRGVGANQTTDQPGMFGAAVRAAVEIPAFDGEPRGVRSAVARAVVAATGARWGEAGPVQLNVAFRDPLTPAAVWQPGELPEDPFPQVAATRRAGGTAVVDGTRRGVVVAGDAAGAEAAALAEGAGWPLLAEPSSGVRRSPHAIAGYRSALAELGAQIEQIVVLGRPTLSRDVSALLARTDIPIVVGSLDTGWVDVAGAAAVVAGDVRATGTADQGWLQDWRAAGERGRRPLLMGEALTGHRVLHAVLAADQEHTVLLGSSLTVRYADLAAGAGAEFTPARVVANRGLAGIDGTISTATGLVLATRAPVRAVVGDLTFLHDVGGLAHGVHEPEVDLQVIVLNDAGGGIFATLEHGRPEHAPVYSRYFGTAQQMDIAALAAGFGASYRLVRTTAELTGVLEEPVAGRSVVEILLT